MQFTQITLGLLLFGSLSFGILPLPVSINNTEDDLAIFTQPPRDPKSIEGYSELHINGKLKEMELPHFEYQNDALGHHSEATFTVPKELRPRVEFWKKVYSEYTSDQAILHDYVNPEIIYEVIDISRYTKDTSTSYRKQMKMLNRYFKEKKETISKRLRELHVNHGDPEKLSVEHFILFKKFESNPNPNKFWEAAERVRAQVGQRDRIVRGFIYGGRYFKKMMEIFEAKGMPQELTRLPLVESAFNLNAKSKVGASGIWQFMRSTGKLYLNINDKVDERNDPLAATAAAAELLRDNYEALGTWPLAISAYNHGREGMARAVRELATTDLATIIKHYKGRTFGFASSNFYSEFLAILEVERDYRKHFGKLMVDSPIEFDELTLQEEMKFSQFAQNCSIDEKELRDLNPALTDRVISGRIKVPQGFKLRIPPNFKDKCQPQKKITLN